MTPAEPRLVSVPIPTEPTPDADAPEVGPGPESFEPTRDAPPGTKGSLRLNVPVVLGDKVKQRFDVLHFPPLTGEHMEHVQFGVRMTIADFFSMGSRLGTYPVTVFKRMHPSDVSRFVEMMAGERFLGEPGPATGASK